MENRCEIAEVAPVLLALAGATVPRREIPARIRGLFDIAYSWLRTAEVRQAGHNYALYDQCSDDALRVRVGFPVTARFPDTESIQCVELPAGRAAHARHVGPYGEMHATYRLLHAWCACEGLALGGESWDVYGDWNDDPTKLVTDIYLRLRT
jgi:effector-binding domain-containing protein